MRLSSITEMAAKKYCPNCGKTMSGHHYWYKGGWRCKGGGKSADAIDGATMPAATQQRVQAIPNGFAQKIAALRFGTDIKLKDGTEVRYLGGTDGGSNTDPNETLYPVRVSSGPDAGQLIMVQPGELDI